MATATSFHMIDTLKSVVAGLTAIAMLCGAAAANLSTASAAPLRGEPPKAIVNMSTAERVTHLGLGAGFIGGGVATMLWGTAGIYAGLAAVGISAVAAPIVIGAVVIGAIGFGAYELTKGIIGKKEASGSNAGRNDTTTPVTLPRVGIGAAGGGAGVHR